MHAEVTVLGVCMCVRVRVRVHACVCVCVFNELTISNLLSLFLRYNVVLNNLLASCLKEVLLYSRCALHATSSMCVLLQTLMKYC